jgi:O-antigen/teichoic acid export membrane protein
MTVLGKDADSTLTAEPPAEPSALRREVLSAGKHSLVYALGQALSRAVGFFMIPVYTRYIAPSGYGAMELIDILFSASLMLLSMGIAEGMSRFYYAEEDQTARDRVVSTAVLGLGAIGIPITLILLALSPLLCAIALEDSAHLLSLQVAIATAWFGMLCEIGYTYLRMRYMARLFVAVTTLQLAAALALNIYFVVFLDRGILGIFYSTLITQAATGLVLAAAMLWRAGLRVSSSILRGLMRFGLPLVPAQIGWMLGFCSNRFFLRWYGSADPAAALAMVGVLSLGFKFGLIVNRFINVPFNSFWAPRRLELLIRSEPHARDTVARMCTYAAACCVFCALAISATISPVVAIVADPAYAGCETVVPIVALTYVVVGLEMHFKTGMIYRRRTVWEAIVSVPALALILVWNYLLVPHFGVLAAATSNLAGFAVQAGLVLIVSQRLYPIPFEIRRIATLLLAAGAVFAVSQLISFPSVWLTFGARAFLVCLFPMVLAVAGFYRRGEVEFLLSSLRRGRRVARSFGSLLQI